MSEDINNKLNKHDILLDRVTQAIEQFSADMKDVKKAIVGQEVLLEKIANVDEKNRDSVNRLHKRIDELLKQIETIKSNCDSGSCLSWKLQQEAIKHNEEDINELKDSQKWVVRTIIGKIIVVVIGAFGYLVAQGN